MRLVNGSISYILSPPTGCAHLVGFKGQDGRVYCSPECATLAYRAQLNETEMGAPQ